MAITVSTAQKTCVTLDKSGAMVSSPVVEGQTDILSRWLLRRRQTLLMELAEIEDVLNLPRTKPSRNR